MSNDNRLKQIQEKMKQLSTKNPKYPCGEFPPKWSKPFTEAEVAEYETKNGIKLPLDYRKFITTIASSGTQPFYGLCSIFKQEKLQAEFNQKFPLTINTPLFLSEEDIDDEKSEELDNGCILLCTEGCGMDNILIVNAKNSETQGTVWFKDMANDFGVAPILDQKTKKPMKFLDWFEFWLDKTLNLPDNEYFSFGELTE